MQILDPIDCGNAADITNACHIMSYSHVEKYPNKNEHLNICFYQNELRAYYILLAKVIFIGNCSRYLANQINILSTIKKMATHIFIATHIKKHIIT